MNLWTSLPVYCELGKEREKSLYSRRFFPFYPNIQRCFDDACGQRQETEGKEQKRGERGKRTPRCYGQALLVVLTGSEEWKKRGRRGKRKITMLFGFFPNLIIVSRPVAQSPIKQERGRGKKRNSFL